LFLSLRLAFVLVLRLAFVLVSEIGPGFSPDIGAVENSGL